MGYTRFNDSTTIIDGVAAIENTTGHTSSAISLCEAGRDSFVLQLSVTPSGTDDGFVWELRPSTFGAATFLTTPLELTKNGTTSGPVMIPLSGAMDNVGTDGATYQWEFRDIYADKMTLFIAADDTTDTYTVTAKYRTLKFGNR